MTVNQNASNLLTASISIIKRWGIKSGFSIIDQGIFSGTNFVVGIFLARWLTTADFGAYAITMGIYMFFYQIHYAFIQEPMSVFALSKYQDRVYGYLIGLVKLHLVIMIPIGVLISFTFWVIGQFLGYQIVIRSLVVLGLGMPFLLLPWLLRRAFNVLQRPGEAVVGSVVYGLVAISLMIYIKNSGLLSVTASFIALEISALICSIYLFWRLYRPSINIDLFTMLKQNWAYGKWLMASSFLVTTAAQAQVFIVGGLIGLETAGILEALQTFMKPIYLTVTAIGGIGLPILAQEYGQGKMGALRRKAFIITGSLTSFAIIYQGFLYFYRVPLENLVFGGKFAAYVNLIPMIGLISIIISINSGTGFAIQAIQKPQAILAISAVWAPVSIGLGFLFTSWWGLRGAIISSVTGYLVAAIGYRIAYSRLIQKPLDNN